MSKRKEKRRVGPRGSTFRSFLKQDLRDPEIREGYRRSKVESEVAIMIAQLRGKKGLNQTELAKKLKTTQTVVSRIEHGDQNLTLRTLSNIAQALGKELKVELV